MDGSSRRRLSAAPGASPGHRPAGPHEGNTALDPVAPASAARGAWLLDVALWAWLLLVAVWIHVLRFHGWFVWDSQLFLAMGRWVAMGLVPYRDAFEVKPPGTFLYLGALFSVLPPSAWAVRFGDVLWTLGAFWAFVRLLRPRTGHLATAIAATAWISWHHNAFFDANAVYTEHYGAVAGLIALACSGPVASGLWAAAAVLCKHPGAAVLVAIAIYRLPDWRWRDWPIFAAAFAAPIAAVMIWFALVGAWEDFLEANLWILIRHGQFANLSLDERLLMLRHSVADIAPLFPSMVVAAALGVAAALLGRSRLAVAALAWWLVAMTGVFLQGRYFEHHYLLVLPPLALMGGTGLGWIIRWRRQERTAVRALRLATAAVVLWSCWGPVRDAVAEQAPIFAARWAELRRGPGAWPQGPQTGFEVAVGRYVHDRTRDGDRIQVQGYSPTLLHIYWYADRPPAAALFYEMPFVLDRPRQLAQAIAGDPAYVIVDRDAKIDPLMLAWLERDYQVEQTFGDAYVVDLWRRRADLGEGDRPQLDAPPMRNPAHFETHAECVDGAR